MRKLLVFFKKWLKKFADKELNSECQTLTETLQQAMNLISMQESQLNGLVDAFGEINDRYQADVENHSNLLLTLLIHCGGEATVSQTITDLVATSFDSVRVDKVDAGYKFSIQQGKVDDE